MAEYYQHGEFLGRRGEIPGVTSTVGHAGVPNVLGLMQDVLENGQFRVMAVKRPDGSDKGITITAEDVNDPDKRQELLKDFPNQDHCVIAPDGSAAVLCDGAGGLGGGAEVSRVASRACAESLAGRWEVLDDPEVNDQDLIHAVHSAMKDADRAIIEAQSREHIPEHRNTWTGRLHLEVRPMPADAVTTLTAVVRPKGRQGTVVIGHAGDTVAKLWRPEDGTLIRLTPNQSQGSLLKNGLDGNVTRRILAHDGNDLESDQVFVVHGIRDTDQVVMFSDGTEGDHPVQELPEQEIVRILSEDPNPATAAQRLATLPRDFKRQNPSYEITYTDKKGQHKSAPFKPKDDDVEVTIMGMRGTPINPDDFDLDQNRNNSPKDQNEALERLGLTAPERRQLDWLLSATREHIASDSNIGDMLTALNISEDNINLYDPTKTTEFVLKGVEAIYMGGNAPGQYIDGLQDPETGMDMGKIYEAFTKGEKFVSEAIRDGGYADTSVLRHRLADDGVLLQASIMYIKQAKTGEVSKRLLQVLALLQYSVSKTRKDQFSRWVDRMESSNWR